MSEQLNIQWFPGHMAKTRRMITGSLKLVDCVAEIVDARLPESSRNPEMDMLCRGKPRIVVLNKCDLADEGETAHWLRYYGRNASAIAVDCKNGRGVSRFTSEVKKLLSAKLERYAAKGMAGRAIRVMVVGIPNCGKSTFINRFAGGRHAKAEDRPGVTRGSQWVTAGGVELLDTPGILWPKFDDPAVGEKLAFIGSVKDDVIDTETLAARLLEWLAKEHRAELCARYKLPEELPDEGMEILSLVAKKRGLLISGGETDTLRASAMLLDEFRAAKIGRFTLDKCPD